MKAGTLYGRAKNPGIDALQNEFRPLSLTTVYAELGVRAGYADQATVVKQYLTEDMGH